MFRHATRRLLFVAILLPVVAGCAVATADPVAEPAPLPGVAAVDDGMTPAPVVVPTVQPEPTREPEPEPEPEPVQQPKAKPAPQPEPEPEPEPQGPETVTLSPITAYGDQSVLDAGNLVTWWHNPCILAGHNTDGWAFLADIPNGTRVQVTSGVCAGTYEVYGHKWVDYRGSETMPDWTNEHDLILQSCVDPVGSGFSFARRL